MIPENWDDEERREVMYLVMAELSRTGGIERPLLLRVLKKVQGVDTVVVTMREERGTNT